MVDPLVVNLGERSYSLAFGGELSAEVRTLVSSLVAAGRKVVVLTDPQVLQQQGPTLNSIFSTDQMMVVKSSGESAKSMQGLEQVWNELAGKRVDRSGVLFAFGGGVIGDLGGFAAASYLRGIDFYQVPTTLLAMVDSSVGGKTGINLSAGKNLVGAFHQPKGVFIATNLLATLPPREFAAGMAEVIKYGLLGDAGLFADLEAKPLTPHSSSLAAVIRRCCELKARIVEADERELAKEGGRALLNLGHTFGHAIEQVTGYGNYLHGEAVAIGLCAAARLSLKLNLISEGDVARVDRVVAAHALPIRLRSPLPWPDLLNAMTRDKKVRAGLPRFVVLEKIGAAVTRDGVDPAWVEASFRAVGAV